MQQHLPDNDHLTPWLNHEGKPALGEDHQDLEQLLTTASELQVPANRSKEEAWRLLESKLSDKQLAPVRSLRPRIFAVAATFVLLMSSGYLWMNRSQLVLLESARAEHRSIELPDGSHVMLNAVSSLEFDKSTWEESRTIYLEGEAFFEVEEGALFQVITSQGTVEVLGTSFNVYAREDKMEVACFTGKVKVHNSKGLAENLTPGRALIHNSSASKSADIFEVEKQKIASWKKGKFYFENEALIDVIAVLERQYDVKVDFPGLEDVRYNGWFTNQNLELALKTICSPLGLQSQMIQENHILLRQAAKVDVEK